MSSARKAGLLGASRVSRSLRFRCRSPHDPALGRKARARRFPIELTSRTGDGTPVSNDDGSGGDGRCATATVGGAEGAGDREVRSGFLEGIGNLSVFGGFCATAGWEREA